MYQQGSGQFEKAHVFQGHDNWVRSLAFATYTGHAENERSLKPGDLILASGSQDKYIRLWKISPHVTTTTSSQANDLMQALEQTALYVNEKKVQAISGFFTFIFVEPGKLSS